MSRGGGRSKAGGAIAILLMCLALPSAFAAEPSEVAPGDESSRAELDAIAELRNAGDVVNAGARARRLLRSIDAPNVDPRILEDTLELLVGLALRTDQDDALPLAQRLVSLREAAGDPIRLARALSHLGQVHHRRHEFEDARRQLERGLVLHEASSSPDEELATTLKMLANLYVDLGENEVAEATFERVLGLDLVETPVQTAATHYSYGRLLLALTEFDRAKATFQLGLDALEGVDHLLRAYLSNSLATIYWELGDYGPARATFTQSLETAAPALGDQHPFVLSCRNNLALIALRIGDYETAEHTFRDVLETRLQSADRRSPEVASTLANLGETLAALDQVDEATHELTAALEIMEDVRGVEHVETVSILERLAAVELEHGRWQSALPRLERLAEFRRTHSGHHVYTSDALTNLGRALLVAAQPEGARQALDEALEILRATVGDRNPRFALAQEWRAAALLAQGDAPAALESALQAESVAAEHAQLTISYLPEGEALSLAGVRTRGIDLAVSSLGDASTGAEVGRVWDAVIRSRALVLDEMTARRAASANLGTASTLRTEYAAASRDLANILVAGPLDNGVDHFQKRLTDARARREGIGRAIAAEARAHREASPANGWAEIRGLLDPGVALVAYLRYDDLSGPAGDASPRFAAWILTPGSAAPHLVKLDHETSLATCFREWRRQVAGGSRLATDPEGAERACRTVGLALRQSIWDPITPHLGPARRVMIVPDGLLNLVNVGALPRDEGGYLVEDELEFHYLASEREVGSGAPREAQTGRVLLVGDVDYGDSDASTERAFEPLAGTGAEVEGIARVLSPHGEGRTGPRLLRGSDATEAAVRDLAPACDVVHLATHGVFLPAGRSRASNAALALRGIGGTSPAAKASRPGEFGFSGLALARANAPRGEDDGILTAEEISAMNLNGTRWAVLSACETGVGPILTGEGVLGLRRAFEVAGAQTLILSLWAVDDDATRDWMVRLYEARWTEGLDTVQSIRSACLSTLSQRREAGASDHPFYWGAFVATGNWQ